MNALRCAVSVGGLMLFTGNVAAASSGHYDSGHLAVMAVVGGAVALGSSALGGHLGGSTSAKRGASEAGLERETPASEPKATTTSREAGALTREPDSAAGLDVKKAATTASDYAAKLVKDASPRGGAIDAAYTVAKGAVSDTDAAAGMAEGLADVATGQLKEAVKSGAAEGVGAATSAPVSAPVGATTRFCRDCGTPARGGARFCASCGRKLA